MKEDLRPNVKHYGFPDDLELPMTLLISFPFPKRQNDSFAEIIPTPGPLWTKASSRKSDFVKCHNLKALFKQGVYS